MEKKGLERKKEEVDEVQKLQVKLKQEQQRWDKECLAREKQQVSFMLVFFKTDFMFLSHLSFRSLCLCFIIVWCGTKKLGLVMSLRQ